MHSSEETRMFLDNEQEKEFPSYKKGSWLPAIILSGIMVSSLFAHFVIARHLRPECSATNPHETGNLYLPFQSLSPPDFVVWSHDVWTNSIFAGPPSAELDQAWNELMVSKGFRVNQEEAKSLNLTSDVHLPGGAYGTLLGYEHNLHCLRWLYQGLHPEAYRRDHLHAHTSIGHSHHCIEVLRTSILCNPDLTPHGLDWIDESRAGVNIRPNSARQCVDFAAVTKIAVDRMYFEDEIIRS